MQRRKAEHHKETEVAVIYDCHHRVCTVMPAYWGDTCPVLWYGGSMAVLVTFLVIVAKC